MENFWSSCVSQLRLQFGDTVFDAFISPTQAKMTDNTHLLLQAPNEATVRWLSENIKPSVREMAQQHFGKDIQIDFQTDMAQSISKPASKTSPSARTKTQVDRTTNLRADLTFDSFVPGRANEIALVAGRAISSGTVDHMSPLLLLYGRTGLGKTHLAQAIANHYLSLHPTRKVRYVMARDFMTDVINACRLNQHAQFKRRYDGLDLLIVDDIQYIGGNMERTQEEFFFLFNKLHDENKIIIITSDRAPSQIRDLPERLTSRLRCGLPTHLAPPELELREAILHKKALARGVKLDEKVTRFVAERIKSNVRELEGALHRILAACTFSGKPPSLEICHEALTDLLESAKETVNVDIIKKKVADFFRLRVSDLSSRSRHRSIAQPRHFAIYLCRQLTNLSLPEIGAQFGDREHTTVLHSCRKIEKELKANSKTQEEIQILEMLIKS